MSKLLPLRPSIPHTPRPRSVLDVADDEAAAVLETLSSPTSRAILAALGEDPATASDLAETLDTTVQNVQYHLTRLREAGVVTDAGTWYSSKGREMTVYALTSARLELLLAADTEASAPETDGRRGDAGRTPAPVRE